jgi:hypothetical protein
MYQAIRVSLVEQGYVDPNGAYKTYLDLVSLVSIPIATTVIPKDLISKCHEVEPFYENLSISVALSNNTPTLPFFKSFTSGFH